MTSMEFGFGLVFVALFVLYFFLYVDGRRISELERKVKELEREGGQ